MSELERLQELQELQTKIIENLSKEIDILHSIYQNQQKQIAEYEKHFNQIKSYTKYLVERMNEMYDNFGDIAKLENFFRKEKLEKLRN